MFLVQYEPDLFPRDLERHASHQCGGGGGANRARSRERLFADKVTGRQQRNGGLLPFFGDDGKLCPARLKIENRGGWTSLGKEELLRPQADESASFSFAGKIAGSIKSLFRFSIHLNGLFLNTHSGKMQFQSLGGSLDGVGKPFQG